MKNEEQDRKGITKNTKPELINETWIIIGRERRWIRKCPKCNRIIYHKREANCKQYDKEKRLCKFCPKLGENNPFYGKHHSNKTKSNFRKQWKEKYNSGFINPNKGKTLTKEQCEKISKANSGSNNAFYQKGFFTGKNHKKSSIDKIRKSLIGRPVSEKTKQKLRESKIRLGNTNYNPKACEYFNKLNEEKGWNLQHALNGGEVRIIGYSLDGYDKERNIVVEYDEPKHFLYGKLKKSDIKRMKRIIKHLKCEFYRYNEKIKTLSKYDMAK